MDCSCKVLVHSDIAWGSCVGDYAKGSLDLERLASHSMVSSSELRLKPRTFFIFYGFWRCCRQLLRIADLAPDGDCVLSTR